MLKRAFVAMMLFVIVVAAAGCGGDATPEPTATTSPGPTATAAPPTATATFPPPPTATPMPAPACSPGGVPQALLTGNLVPNPSMEDGPAGWRRLRSDGRELPVVIDGAVSHSGACSLRFNRRTDSDCPTICGYWTSDVMPVDPSRAYRLSIWVRTSDSLDGVQLGVNFRTFDAAGPRQEVSGIARQIGPGWTEISGLIGPIQLTGAGSLGGWPPGTTGMILDIAWLGSPARDGRQGEIWIDDVFFGPR